METSAPSSPLNARQLAADAIARLPYTPTFRQALLLEVLARYICGRDPRDVFIINGYAGTGKTSIIGAMIAATRDAGLRTHVLAPTGRAAKVASAMAGMPASTIHKRIFRGDSSDPANTRFFLAPNNDRDAIFFVDEASMITDNASDSLLAALLRHIYSAPGCGLVLVGDVAQLPPVGQPDSPAMNPDRLRALGFNPYVFQLEEPARQAAGSGILFNATITRRRLGKQTDKPFALKTRGFADICVVDSAELADCVADSWSGVGAEETIIITRSNRRANEYNSALRARVLYAEGPIESGERLIIAKNNYFWTRTEGSATPFLANGETAVVQWVGRTEKMYGRNFTDVELTLPGRAEPISAKIMLRSLVAEGPALDQAEMNRFYSHVMAMQEGSVTQRMAAVGKDPYFNALQVKYGYCVTCHKAQGGQWRHVYIDLGGIRAEDMTDEFYRWLYTALTRATERVFLINPTMRIVS